MPVLEAFLRVMADRCTPTKGGARHRYEGPIADSTGIPVRDQSRGDPSTERRAAESKDSYASGMAQNCLTLRSLVHSQDPSNRELLV